jgi:transposase
MLRTPCAPRSARAGSGARRYGCGGATQTIAADRRGYQAALQFVEQCAPGRRVWALEGTGGYGAGLALFLADRDQRVLEVDRPAQNDQRTQTKGDQLDAVRAARTPLGRDRHAQPRAGGVREALRALVTTRAGAVEARTAAINQLNALVVGAPEPLRDQLRGLTHAQLLGRCARLRPHPPQPGSTPPMTERWPAAINLEDFPPVHLDSFGPES